MLVPYGMSVRLLLAITLQHFREKWVSIFVRKMPQLKEMEHISISEAVTETLPRPGKIYYGANNDARNNAYSRKIHFSVRDMKCVIPNKGGILSEFYSDNNFKPSCFYAGTDNGIAKFPCSITRPVSMTCVKRLIAGLRAEECSLALNGSGQPPFPAAVAFD